MTDEARYLARWELDDVGGVVVAVDVIRAFTTAAYALAGGASAIWLVAGVDEALELAAAIPGALVMGEEHGRRPPGFHLSNSPVHVSEADVDGRVIVQRTSAGTQGVVAARAAERLFAASLVCASATAAAVEATALGVPTYVITGRFPDKPDGGEDDLLTAQLIERARTGRPLQSRGDGRRGRPVTGGVPHPRARRRAHAPRRLRLRHRRRPVRLRDGGRAGRRRPVHQADRPMTLPSGSAIRTSR